MHKKPAKLLLFLDIYKLNLSFLGILSFLSQFSYHHTTLLDTLPISIINHILVIS